MSDADCTPGREPRRIAASSGSIRGNSFLFFVLLFDVNATTVLAAGSVESSCMLLHQASIKGNPLKFAGVPQTHQMISAVSGPKFTML